MLGVAVVGLLIALTPEIARCPPPPPVASVLAAPLAAALRTARAQVATPVPAATAGT